MWAIFFAHAFPNAKKAGLSVAIPRAKALPKACCGIYTSIPIANALIKSKFTYE